MNQTLLFTLNILLLNITGNRYLYTLTCLFDIIDSFIYVCVDSWKKGEKFENLIKQNLYQRAHFEIEMLKMDEYQFFLTFK